MPQLDPSSYISQIFWLTVTFLSLWFLMSVFIIPKIKNVIDEREQKIAEYIEKAERINKQANDALKRYENHPYWQQRLAAKENKKRRMII